MIRIQFSTFQMANFIQKHPNLEHLSVDFGRMLIEGLQPLLDGAKKFEKLKSLTCSCRTDGISSKYLCQIMYFNNLLELQFLKQLYHFLNIYRSRGCIGRYLSQNSIFQPEWWQALYDRHNRPTKDVLHDRECLSSIRFPHLSSLILQKFYLGDGYFLQPVIFWILKDNFKYLKCSLFILLHYFLQIIAQCPKLEEIYLFGRIAKHSKFASNLKLFFQKALKLRKFRLQ